jgi:hypothetical protein
MIAIPTIQILKVLVFLCLTLKRRRLCGLVVRVLGYRSGGQVSIPGTTRKEKVMGQPREYN